MKSAPDVYQEMFKGVDLVYHIDSGKGAKENIVLQSSGQLEINDVIITPAGTGLFSKIPPKFLRENLLKSRKDR